MGAQQVKEGRSGIASNNTTVGSSGIIGTNNGCNTITGNCSAINNSVSSSSTFGAGSSLRASRINKSRTPKDSKIIGLNIFTEHNGKPI